MYAPDPVSYNPGFAPGQQFQHQPHYPAPSHHYPPSGGPGPAGDGTFHDSYNASTTPQQNDHWARQPSQPHQPPPPPHHQQQQQQQQQQPSVMINDGSAVSDGGSPAPRSSIGWGPSGVKT